PPAQVRPRLGVEALHTGHLVDHPQGRAVRIHRARVGELPGRDADLTETGRDRQRRARFGPARTGRRRGDEDGQTKASRARPVPRPLSRFFSGPQRSSWYLMGGKRVQIRLLARLSGMDNSGSIPTTMSQIPAADMSATRE